MKYWLFLKRHLLQRRLPHGVVSPRYLLPGQSRNIRLHRLFWLRSLPRFPLPLFLVMEIFLYARWILFSAWLGVWRTVKRWGPGVREQEGIGAARLFLRLLGSALFHCIPPADACVFGLYRPGRQTTIWDYVFTHEVAAFHHWRNLSHGKTAASAKILADKYQTSRILARHGLPAVPVLALIPAGDNVVWQKHFEKHKRLFLKPGNGSAAEGCFVLEKGSRPSGCTVFATRGGMVAKPSTHAYLKKHLNRKSYLVQPFMPNHPLLSSLCTTKDAATVRIITEVSGDAAAECSCALLEIPGPANDTFKKNKDKQRSHLILSIDLTTGSTIPIGENGLPIISRAHHKVLYTKAANIPIPFWKKIKDRAFAAHALFSDIYAVAWDFVITPEGAYLLEGNTGWGTSMPQVFNGGFLSTKQTSKQR